MGTVIHSPWEYEMKPFQITDDLWDVGDKNVAAHIKDTGEGLILFDTCYPQTTYLLLEAIRDAGFDPHDIKYIFHTHLHYDHIGATRRLVEKFGCKTFVGKDDADFLTTKTELLWHREFGVEYQEYFQPDVLLNDGDVVRLGNTEIKCITAPGHTPGTMCYLFNTVYDGKTYTAGLHGGFGMNTLTTEYMFKYGLKGWREAYESTLNKLRNLNVDITLGAHPDFNCAFEKNDARYTDFNPFIDSEEWQIMISDAQEKYQKFVLRDPQEPIYPNVYKQLEKRIQMKNIKK